VVINDSPLTVNNKVEGSQAPGRFIPVAQGFLLMVI
jgi:hypothetical protein